jgi:hypothetical protein
MRINRKATQFLAICATTLALAWGASAADTAVYYKTPDEAVKALIKAAQTGTDEAIKAALGGGVEEIGSGDAVQDQEDRKLFASRAMVKYRTQPYGANYVEILIGADEWPFAIPLVKESQGYRFDTDAGMQELINRRVGRNELAVIDIMRAYVDAQNEYAARDPQKSGVNQYAQKLASSEGKRDGLYWPVKEGEQESPLGPLLARATREGYELKTGAQANPNAEPTPYHGYIFRILKGQGKSVAGGARSYVKNGRMTEGFGLIAYPVEYDNSGVMTFIVNQRGIVYQKDLGKDTAKLAAAIQAYDPDRSWKPVADQ